MATSSENNVVVSEEIVIQSLLQFSKVGKIWKAEATVNADFNLHVETSDFGRLTIKGTTVSGGQKDTWATAAICPPCYDHDYDSRVYPKYLEIISTVAVTSAKITEVG